MFKIGDRVSVTDGQFFSYGKVISYNPNANNKYVIKLHNGNKIGAKEKHLKLTKIKFRIKR